MWLFGFRRTCLHKARFRSFTYFRPCLRLIRRRPEFESGTISHVGKQVAVCVKQDFGFSSSICITKTTSSGDLGILIKRAVMTSIDSGIRGEDRDPERRHVAARRRTDSGQSPIMNWRSIAQDRNPIRPGRRPIIGPRISNPIGTRETIYCDRINCDRKTSAAR
jgi:hypothetical protein